MALLDTQVAMLANQGANYLVTGEVPGAPAMRTRTSCPTRCSIADGHMILAVGNDSQFAKLLRRWPAARTRARPALRHATPAACATATARAAAGR